MSSYLMKMGIDRWTLRQKEKLVLSACYAYELFYEGQCVGLLFAAAEQEDPVVADLLKKIIAALRCTLKGQWYPVQPVCEMSNEHRFVITLGEGFEVQQGARHIHSHAPQRLIAEPKLKAETWKELQTVLSMLAPT